MSALLSEMKSVIKRNEDKKQEAMLEVTDSLEVRGSSSSSHLPRDHKMMASITWQQAVCRDSSAKQHRETDPPCSAVIKCY